VLNAVIGKVQYWNCPRRIEKPVIPLHKPTQECSGEIVCDGMIGSVSELHNQREREIANMLLSWCTPIISAHVRAILTIVPVHVDGLGVSGGRTDVTIATAVLSTGCRDSST
jgi:hypothetical protein